MSTKKGPKRGRGYSNPPFVGLAIGMLRRNQEWRDLSASAKIFYIHLKSKYNGNNNGKIKFHYSELKGVKGCGNNHTISKASQELQKEGWISRTKIGGLYRYYNLYKLTFKHDDFN